jgi:hypothetical protein
MSEEKEIGWGESKRVRWVYGEAEPIFFVKSSVFSSGVGSCVISMNNESPLINLRAEQKKFCKNINTAVLGMKCVAF